MPSLEYLFQKRKRSFTQRFFEKGLNAATYILFTLQENGKLFLRELPNSYPQFQIMKEIFGVGYKKYPEFKKETIRTNFYRLENQGLIIRDPKQKFYILTNKGEELVSYIKNRYSILKKPWDGKWRIVIFDIPEEKKRWREWIREELVLLQFQQLQKSVYIGKYPLSESFYEEIIKAGLNKYIFVLTVGEIDREEEILKLFKNRKK